MCAMMAQTADRSSLDRRARVRVSLGETEPCTLIAPGAYEIRRGCSVFQVPTQIIPLGVPKRGSHLLSGGSKL